MKRHCVCLQLRFEAPKDAKLEMLPHYSRIELIMNEGSFRNYFRLNHNQLWEVL